MATKEEKASALRDYPDGEEIPEALPDAYRPARKTGETKGQACINCKFFKEDTPDHRYYCTKWEAPIRPQYWCAAWASAESELQESYNDYPKSASNNAQRALDYKADNPDNDCGTAVGWARANQLAKGEKISRETIARMASFKRHQQHKDVPYSEGCGGLMWDAWGGTSGVEWAIRKLKQIDKKAASNMEQKFAFGIQGIDESKVDQDAGTMLGVSLISVGPALGHGLFVDATSLETIEDELDGAKLPAYITHRGALFEDRLTREIGMFENFRIDGDRLLGDFQAFDSFREDDSRKYNRLFEMAQKMPERFGLSIVFSATSAWATPDGDIEIDEKPEDALFEFPSIRVEEVSSADFVDSPAANQRGLFSKIDKPTTSKMTKAELTEKNDELVAEAEALEAKLTELQTKLEEHSEDETNMESLAEENEKLKEENESLKAELEDLKGKMTEGEEEMSKLKEELESSQVKAEEDAGEMAAKEARIAELSKLIEGSDPVQFSEGEADYTPSKVNRNKAIAEYAAEHGISEFTATLRLGKEKPEIFTL